MALVGGKRAGAGRKPGVPNKYNRDIKEMIIEALHKAGGSEYLYQQARTSPAAFLTLVGKVLPLQLSGPNGGPVEMIVTGVRRAIDEDEASEQLAIESGVLRDVEDTEPE